MKRELRRTGVEEDQEDSLGHIKDVALSQLGILPNRELAISRSAKPRSGLNGRGRSGRDKRGNDGNQHEQERYPSKRNWIARTNALHQTGEKTRGNQSKGHSRHNEPQTPPHHRSLWTDETDVLSIR
jgi:hypothetical protein